MKFNFLFVVLLSASAITACAASPNAVEPIKQAAPAAPETPAMTESAPHEPATPAPDRISATGTVRFLDISGGFWGIVGDDGRKFDPMELDAAFQKEGLRVRFEAVPETDMMSTRMWGTMIALVHIEALE